MSVTSAAHKPTSKIYQDLRRARLSSTGSPRRLSIMDRVLKVFNTGGLIFISASPRAVLYNWT